MKFLPLLATALAIATATASASADYQPEMLGERSLPAESRHPLSMQRRKAMFDEHYRKFPMERRTSSGSKRKCKAKTKKAAGSKTAETKYHSQSQSHSNKNADQGAGKEAVAAAKENHASSSTKNKSESNSQSQSQSSSQSESKSESKSSSNDKTAGSEVASSGGSGSGLIGMKFNACGNSGATKDLPNGAQWFLNCGVDNGGWNPPDVKLHQLKAIDADEAIQGAFKECKDVAWAFKQVGKAHDLPPVLLMSFAMQESTCNPSVTGGNGEQGLMQITQDKCGGAPNGNCKDVYFNVNAGAKYFKDTLSQCNGNVLEALGRYNGWQPGMTVAKATAAKKQGNCHAQNNLDYLFQMLNGWMLGKVGYNMGQYQNLKDC